MIKPGEKSGAQKNQVQVIARAASILRALEGEDAGLSLGEIARKLNLARSTVQRIVASLEAEKLVIAASPNGRVRLGPTILRLAARCAAISSRWRVRSSRSCRTSCARPSISPRCAGITWCSSIR